MLGPSTSSCKRRPAVGGGGHEGVEDICERGAGAERERGVTRVTCDDDGVRCRGVDVTDCEPDRDVLTGQADDAEHLRVVVHGDVPML